MGKKKIAKTSSVSHSPQTIKVFIAYQQLIKLIPLANHLSNHPSKPVTPSPLAPLPHWGEGNPCSQTLNVLTWALGTIMGILGIFLGSLFWNVSWQIGLSVGLTLLAVVIWSTTIGALVHILADRVG